MLERQVTCDKPLNPAIQWSKDAVRLSTTRDKNEEVEIVLDGFLNCRKNENTTGLKISQ